MHTFTREERDILLREVTPKQSDFLLNNLKRGKKTSFLNLVANEKVTLVRSTDITLTTLEQDITGWHLEGYIDYGAGNLLGECACGRKLRKVFTVKHEGTGKTIDYGEEHFKQFLGIDSKVLKTLVMDLTAIDLELDELLYKISNGQYDYDLLETDFAGMDLPKDIQDHIDAEVPLLDRQVARLYMTLREIERKLRKAKNEAYYKALAEEHERLQEQIEKEKNKLLSIVRSVRDSLDFSELTMSNIAYQLVVHGVSSTVEICNILIDFFDFDAKLARGTLKRPYIYADVLMTLLKREEKGELILVRRINIEDCLFNVSFNR